MVWTCKKGDKRGVLRVVEDMEIPGKQPDGRPKRTWKGTVHEDTEVLGIEKELPLDHRR